MTERIAIALENDLPTPDAAVEVPQPTHEQPVSLPALYRALWLHAEGARHLIFGAFGLLLA